MITPTGESEVEKVRLAFIERPNRPTYQELAEEFEIPLSTIGKWSVQDGWAAMRASYLERKATEGDALSVILEASSRVNRPVMAAIANAVLVVIQGVTQCVQDIDPEKQKSPATRAEILNTCAFTIKNVADACKSIGIVGLTKHLGDIERDGKESGGWTPQLAQQINVTLQNFAGKPEPQAVAGSSTGSPIPEPLPTT